MVMDSGAVVSVCAGHARLACRPFRLSSVSTRAWFCVRREPQDMSMSLAPHPVGIKFWDEDLAREQGSPVRPGPREFPGLVLLEVSPADSAGTSTPTGLAAWAPWLLSSSSASASRARFDHVQFFLRANPARPSPRSIRTTCCEHPSSVSFLWFSPLITPICASPSVLFSLTGASHIATVSARHS